MRRQTAVLIAATVIWNFGFANDFSPFGAECRFLDKIQSAMNSDSNKPQSDLLLALLERIALGGRLDLDGSMESRLGVKGTELEHLDFKAPYVRAYALRMIGESSLPDALEFLSTLQQIDIGPDATQEMWPAAQIALINARLIRTIDRRSKTELLERALVEKRVHYGGGAVAYWVVNQLCNSGSVTSLSVIRQSIRSRVMGRDGEEEIRFCEARIEVVSRHPDRVTALGSILQVGDGVDPKLLRWAMYQLRDMHSQAAEAELDRFAVDIGQVPLASRRQQLEGLRREIESMHAPRKQ